MDDYNGNEVLLRESHHDDVPCLLFSIHFNGVGAEGHFTVRMARKVEKALNDFIERHTGKLARRRR